MADVVDTVLAMMAFNRLDESPLINSLLSGSIVLILIRLNFDPLS